MFHSLSSLHFEGNLDLQISVRMSSDILISGKVLRIYCIDPIKDIYHLNEAHTKSVFNLQYASLMMKFQATD